ncbi:uncharacterized protein LOC128175322 [Crassostrea angulata]|uniref:uncharacterized protein LOC128175322 n=1 Tax=Magallana angulata TaxID=2784310 RepID=UPI0022B1A7D1|nr:uncharacterized protein LOC128175322 [Crassostrea angulata]
MFGFQQTKTADNESTKQAVDPGFPETDVTLIVEDQKIHVNKAVLSEHSPVFGTMFKSQFKERSAKEITLVDKKAADVVEFLKSFYPNMNHPINSNNVLQVLPLAHEYQSPLVADCEDFMIAMCKPDKGLAISTLLDYILAGDKYGLTRFLEAAVEFCANIDYQLLSGKSNSVDPPFAMNISNRSEATIAKPISWKFSEIELKTRFAIAEKRLSLLEKSKSVVLSKKKSFHRVPIV